MALVGRVTCNISGLPGQNAISLFHFINDSDTWTPALAQVAVDKVRDFWVGNAPSFLPAMTVITNSIVQLIDLATGDLVGTAIAPLGRATIGTATGDALPLSTQFHVTWHTGLYTAGHELKGGTFLPGCVEGDNVGTVPVTSVQSRMATGANSLIAGTFPKFSVYSRRHQLNANVQSYAAPLKWSVLRGRRA